MRGLVVPNFEILIRKLEDGEEGIIDRFRDTCFNLAEARKNLTDNPNDTTLRDYKFHKTKYRHQKYLFGALFGISLHLVFCDSENDAIQILITDLWDGKEYRSKTMRLDEYFEGVE
jgi:hypothetical protein